MNRSDLHLGDVWSCRMGALTGERQVVAMFTDTVTVSATCDAQLESYRWGEIEFLTRLRKAHQLEPAVIP